MGLQRYREMRAPLPQFVAPQLATLVSAPPAAGEWLYEVKHDGYRLLARISDDEVKLYTRAGNDWSAKLPRLQREIGKLGLRDTWLDGEIVVLGPDGRASFQRLQNAFDAHSDAAIVYFVFDAPFLDGKDQRRLALKERKARLRRMLKSSPAVRFSEDLQGDAKHILDKACKLGLEGLIGKQADSVYSTGRTRSWIKLKCRARQDFVIGGYTPPKGSRSGFGAILAGTYDVHGKLHYAGKVGTGFDEERLGGLMRRFAPLRQADSPFAAPPKEEGVQWLRPKLVAEVAYAERTDEGLLRQAAFMGLRDDIAAKTVGEERAEKPLTITSPERLVWPSLKIRKIDLVRYAEQVGEWFLPHLKNRPLTLVRCPDGAEAKCFYQRHERGSKDYMHLSTLEEVLGALQNGAVEFHTWGATLPDVKRPDRVTIDLDPDPELPWAALVEATRLTRTLLESLKLKCFLKTTGGKGLHVVAPLVPGLEWEEVKRFTRQLAEFLVKARPDLFVANMSKSKRGGKVFVDYLRNAETASAVAAYSPRARADAGVSTPVSWDELGKKDIRKRFTVKSVPRRLKRLGADPWADYARTRQAITPAMVKALREGQM